MLFSENGGPSRPPFSRLVHAASVVSKIAFPTVRNSVTGRGGVEKVLTLNLTADEKALFESNRFSARLDRQTKRLASKPVFTSR